MRPSLSRRAVLAGGAAVAVPGTLAALAGCSGSMDEPKPSVTPPEPPERVLARQLMADKERTIGLYSALIAKGGTKLIPFRDRHQAHLDELRRRFPGVTPSPAAPPPASSPPQQDGSGRQGGSQQPDTTQQPGGAVQQSGAAQQPDGSPQPVAVSRAGLTQRVVDARLAGAAQGSPGSSSPTPSAPQATATPVVTLSRLRDLERRSAALRTRQLAGIPPAFAQLVASIGACEAAHAVALPRSL